MYLIFIALCCAQGNNLPVGSWKMSKQIAKTFREAVVKIQQDSVSTIYLDYDEGQKDIYELQSLAGKYNTALVFVSTQFVLAETPEAIKAGLEREKDTARPRTIACAKPIPMELQLDLIRLAKEKNDCISFTGIPTSLGPVSVYWE